MEPIIKIEDFSQGISYDETEVLLNGFNDLQNVDLKNINGAVMLGEAFTSNSNDFLWANDPVNWRVQTYDSDGKNAFVQRLYSTAGNQIYAFNGTTWSLFMSTVGGAEPPVYGELGLFKNSLVYSSGLTEIGTCFGWTSGRNTSVSVTNGSPTVTISTSKTQQLFSRRQVGGLIYIWNGTAYVSYTISAWVSTTQITLSTNYVGSTTSTTRAYSYTFDSTGVTNEAGVHTTLTLPNKTAKYRPMADFNSKLYVGDGDMVCSLDDTLTVWSTTNGNKAISVGSDYTVKQIRQIGGYLYILADKSNSYAENAIEYNFIDPESRLYIWDGTSVGFTNIVDIGTHCYCIRTIENRIYALLKSNKGDGALFTYFNGSDFPTIGKIQLSSVSCPLSNLAYDRGRFYIVAKGTDTNGTSIGAVYSYSAYATETPCMFKNYQVTSALMYGIGFIQANTDATRILMVSIDNADGVGGGLHTQARSLSSYLSSGVVQTQKYEITPNQFGQLVKAVQLNFKETMHASGSVELYYKGDDETSFTLFGTLTSANQNNPIYGINKRFRKLQIKLILKTSNSSYTPKVVKISIY